MPSGRVERGPEAEYIDSFINTSNTWLEVKHDTANISFQHPEGLFRPDYAASMRYVIETKPTVGEDGVCSNDLGDIDCEIAFWPQRYTNFQGALQGWPYIDGEYTDGEYKAILAAYRVRSIGQQPFIVAISHGVNGSCSMDYIRATPLSYVRFSFNICDDPSLDLRKWFGSTVDAQEREKANHILDGKNVSDSTRIKMDAMERVLATLRME